MQIPEAVETGTNPTVRHCGPVTRRIDAPLPFSYESQLVQVADEIATTGRFPHLEWPSSMYRKPALAPPS